MASSGDDGRVVVDLRSAAEAAARTGEEDTHAQPIHEIESLCMRCGENVSVPRSLPLVFSFSRSVRFGAVVAGSEACSFAFSVARAPRGYCLR